VLASAVMFLALSLWWSYQAFPEEYSVDTNYCQYAQGRLFAQGVVWGRGKEFRGLSSMWTCMLNVPLKGSASKYPPGYSGLITVAWSLGSTRVLNPLCGALTLALVMLTTMRVYGSRLVTGWFVALSFLSVYFVHMSAEFWNHPSALLACAAIVWSVSRERGREIPSFIAVGLAIVFCILTRPLSGIAMAIFVGGVGVARWKRGEGAFVRPVAMMVGAGASTVLGIVLLGAYNQILTGSAFVSGYEMLHGTPHNPGFHVDPYGRDFTPWAAVQDLLLRWRSLNVWLFMWPIPSLTLLAVWCLSYRRWVRGDWLFVWWLAVQSLVYCYMWSAGQVQYGPRFLYEALPAVVVLSARGAAILEETLLAGAFRRVIFRVLIVGCSAFGFWRYAHVVGVLS
jgi:hypothetical protein